MKALMVSTSYPTDDSDWKGLFIRRLAEALARRREIDLRLWSPPGPLPGNSRLDLTPDEQRWLLKLMADGGIAHLMRTSRVAGGIAAAQLLYYLRRVFRRNQDVDVYHVNWLQNALALPANRRPALLTALGTDMQLLRLPGVKALLRRALRNRKAAICPNAEWMVEPLSAAFGDVARIQYVPFGVDPRWFQIQRQPPDAEPRRWLVVSRLTQNKLGPLFDWCRPHFESGQRELHLLGPMQEQVEVPSWVHYHGPATPDQLANRWFPQSSGLITLSRHAEGRPQVMLEAMAAGLPIVASGIAAHEDFLKHGQTGWICADPDAFADAIGASEGDAGTAIGENARTWVRNEIGTWDDCAQRYVSLYEGLTRET
ncbi:glycosyltransferase family 4 protein [Lysobacter sp. TAF61]|uniref:glycosyltransferase family 4 protein n=1 Tax=Lysobacter sp. TAF61 TaxID=3233072 RepID=UPI003F95457B